MTLRQLPTINTVKNLLILIFLFVIKDCNGFTVLLNKRRSPNRVNRLQTIISNGPKIRWRDLPLQRICLINFFWYEIRHNLMKIFVLKCR